MGQGRETAIAAWRPAPEGARAQNTRIAHLRGGWQRLGHGAPAYGADQTTAAGVATKRLRETRPRGYARFSLCAGARRIATNAQLLTRAPQRRRTLHRRLYSSGDRPVRGAAPGGNRTPARSDLRAGSGCIDRWAGKHRSF